MVSKRKVLPFELVRRIRPDRYSNGVLVYQDPRRVEDIADYLSQEGYRTQYLHGGICAQTRDVICFDFMLGRVDYLVTTPVISRRYQLTRSVFQLPPFLCHRIS